MDRMHPDLERLKSLQEVDREIQRLTDEIATLPRRVADVEAKLASTKSQIEQENSKIKQNDAAKRGFESEIQSLQQKISKYREQSLDVKTNEQYKAFLHEIEFAEKQVRDYEEKILVMMVEAESHEKNLKAAEAEFKTQGALIEKEKAEVRARSEEDEKALAEWRAKRGELRTGIPAQPLEHYDRILPPLESEKLLGRLLTDPAYLAEAAAGVLSADEQSLLARARREFGSAPSPTSTILPRRRNCASA